MTNCPKCDTFIASGVTRYIGVRCHNCHAYLQVKEKNPLVLEEETCSPGALGYWFHIKEMKELGFVVV
jgi:hypothetical protein